MGEGGPEYPGGAGMALPADPRVPLLRSSGRGKGGSFAWSSDVIGLKLVDNKLSIDKINPDRFGETARTLERRNAKKRLAAIELLIEMGKASPADLRSVPRLKALLKHQRQKR